MLIHATALRQPAGDMRGTFDAKPGPRQDQGKKRAGQDMQIYLPIAEVVVNSFTLVGLGGIVGLMSGLFGVGGGFLITPLLFFIGIPPAIAVATGDRKSVV